MLNLTRLLTGTATPGDGLRYGETTAAPGGLPPQRQLHHRPVVVWNITRRCNLHCLHCYISAADRDFPGEFTHEEALGFINELADYQVPVLLFSGGEPLLRPALPELMAQAVGRGLRVVLSTNGVLITSQVAHTLHQTGLSYVGVSLDGLEPVHDRFRGKRGAFRASLDGIHHCLDAGVRTGVRFTLTRYNLSDLESMFDLVEREGIPRLCIYHLVYAGRGQGARRLDLDAAQARVAMDTIIRRTLRWHETSPQAEVLTVDNHADSPYLYLWALANAPDRAAEVYRLLRRNGGNSSGVGIADVDNLGNVHADQFWQHYSFGNVRRRPFPEIWEDTRDPVMHGLKDRKGLLKGRCATCRFLELCNGNLRLRAEAVHGDLWAPDPACYLNDAEVGAGLAPSAPVGEDSGNGTRPARASL
ncbi:MAG: radical SAM protein [Chloroflexi bacterium]|nr:radical SAM protein [Chloroflexota bacterium]